MICSSRLATAAIAWAVIAEGRSHSIMYPVKPLTHDPSRPPVVMADGCHDGQYFLAAVLTARQDRSCDKGCHHDGCEDSCQKTTPVVTAIMTGLCDVSCVKGFSATCGRREGELVSAVSGLVFGLHEGSTFVLLLGLSNDINFLIVH